MQHLSIELKFKDNLYNVYFQGKWYYKELEEKKFIEYYIISSFVR